MPAPLHHSLADQGISTDATIHANLDSGQLTKAALDNGEGRKAKHGPLVVETGKHTGRSAKDKFIVRDAETESTVWWDNNASMTPDHFAALKEDFFAALGDKDALYVADLFGGSQAEYRVNVRVINELAWHNQFIRTLLVRPTEAELADFVPEYTIIDLPSFKADPERHGCRSETVIAVNLSEKLILIGGTKYAGEMKKSVFGVLNYLLPPKGVMPMHCSANIGPDGKTAVFFGLSGTGKTTLSADASRTLIGDDEHGWSDTAVFNFEGGCYAKTINLSQKNEPIIWDAIRFGAIVENVVVDEQRHADYDDTSLTENGRCCYPLEHVEKRVLENAAGEPKTVIFLTCDVSGVLPPVSILSKEAAAFHFLSGYTARVGSTEIGAEAGIHPTFSTCFGAPFMPRPANEYAELLMKRIEDFESQVYLINTGWTGGSGAPGGEGSRFPIPVTRAVVAAAQSGALMNAETEQLDILNLTIPTSIPGVDDKYVNPRKAWSDQAAYDEAAQKLAKLFQENIQKFDPSDAVVAAGPKA